MKKIIFLSFVISMVTPLAHASQFAIICSSPGGTNDRGLPYKDLVAIEGQLGDKSGQIKIVKVVEAGADEQFRDLDLHTVKRASLTTNGNVVILTGQSLGDGAQLYKLYNIPANFQAQSNFGGVLRLSSRAPADMILPITRADAEISCVHGVPQYVK